MTGVKTNERPGTRAVLKHSGVSAYKAREVLDLIRGKDFERASEILEYCDREVATVIGKVLHSAAANAFHNDGGIESEELFVSACYADEGTTLKRWRPRARGRASRIRKRTCHITVIVSRLPEDELNRRRARVAAEQADRRARRVAGARRQGRAGAAAKAGTSEAPQVDEQVLDIVAAGDAADATDLDAAVEQALADEDDGQAESTEDAPGEDDEHAESADGALGDEETSD
ncbi:MAG: 50S ribosomal protein L22 [Acidimicrobiales bacterium]